MKCRNFYRLILAVLPLVLLSLGFIITSCEKDDKDALPDGVTRIFIKTMPDVAFALDAPLDLSGMVLSIERKESTTDVPFADFEKAGITVVPANGTILDFTHHSLTITHKPSGKGVVQAIDVTNKVASLAVKMPPVMEYEVADTLDLSSLVISLVRENGESKDLAFKDFKDLVVCVPAQGDTLSENQGKVTITYLPAKVSMDIDIKVNPFLPQSGSIKTKPAKVDYGIGERLDLTGLVMEYAMASGKIIEVPFKMFPYYGIVTSIPNRDVLGTDDASLSVIHTNSGTAVDLDLSVDPNLVIKSMYVKSFPTKLMYKVGEAIDLTGLEITIVRGDNRLLDIPFEFFSKLDLETSPANGVSFDLSIPNVEIKHVKTGFLTRSPLKILVPGSALKVLLPAVSPEKWSIKNHFEAGVEIYSDRSYKVGVLPNELRGLQWVQTTMDLMVFTEEQVASLKLPGAYTVYIAHCLGNKTAPAWILDNWEATNLTMKLDNNLPFKIYKKDFEAGEEIKLYKFANTLSKPAPPYILVFERR